jgi:pyruvate dehydrogenase E2 component (dihydrolipoamide acetyltransferase)
LGRPGGANDDAESAPVAAANEGVRATPLARSTARAHGIALESLAGSGPRGRVVARDIEAQVESRTSQERDTTLVPFGPVRRIVAQRLAESARTIPHFYLAAQVEMTALGEALRARAPEVLAAIRTKPTLTMLVAHIVARVLSRHPHLNASVEGDAMDRDGDLVVPVLRQAGTRSLVELVRDYVRLRDAVRSRTIAPADLRGATFTITNLGMYGVDSFTAIIDPPQAAILAVGRTRDTPVGRDGAVVLRPMATFTLSSDHRIVDGTRAARFMADLREAIENPSSGGEA